ncbi:MAG: DNA double-strand break repair nuclease NurA [Synechococcales bacterium]|nr:DNA double-strand break repair nuclease NurA [Synechococcales bacterium]
MLDFTKLARQMQGVSHHLVAESAALREKLRQAEQLMLQAQTHQAELVTRQTQWRDRLIFTAAEPIEPLETRVTLPAPPSAHTVLATDGSQIAPSHHEIAYCYLINIGRIILHYGQSKAPLLDSLPEVFYRPEDLFVSRQWGIRTEEWMGYCRTAAEAEVLAELAIAVRQSQRNSPLPSSNSTTARIVPPRRASLPKAIDAEQLSLLALPGLESPSPESPSPGSYSSGSPSLELPAASRPKPMVPQAISDPAVPDLAVPDLAVPDLTVPDPPPTVDMPTAAIPTIAMVDGSLIYWFLEPLPGEARDRILQPILQAWRQLQRIGVPLIGYVSASRSGEALNFLRLQTCPYPAPDCATHCAHLPDKTPCQVLEPLRDGAVWARLLQPGQRSPLWRSSARIQGFYDEQAIYFCYVHVGSEIARVEMPEWVVQDGDRCNAALSLVLAQVQKGYGYPVALAEAHNQAVVRGSDRARFFALLEQQMVKAGLRNVGTSYKEARKRGSIA